ncbi:MAG: RDD family protein, partial [Terriglobales bacterium]
CADCKPAFVSRVMASGAAGASPTAWRYGGFWVRFGARFVDGLIFTVPVVILFVMLMPNLIRAGRHAPNRVSPINPAFAGFGFITLFVVLFLAGGCYEILMLKYRSATLGKMAYGLKVIRPDGHSLSWGVCFGRFFMWNVVTSGIPYINSVLMLVSSIMLGVDDEKRALHDRVCDTRVIYKQGVA